MTTIPATMAQKAQATTSFQTGQPYRPELDIKSDIAIPYTNSADVIKSWADAGYIVHTMGGFRLGEDYISKHPEDGQTTRDGTILTCGPGSYYLSPSPRRVQMMVDHFLAAIRNGSKAVIPEEPEYFAAAGYEQAFKDAWKQRYNEDWQDPASSWDNRIKAERLKGEMQYHLVRSILQAAQKEDPSVLRMTAHHSPVSYHSWGITFPFDDFAKMPELQEVIGQVWTGTARTAFVYSGVLAERTYLNALMEYSSLVELYRGTGKKLWFLADPLEDNPYRSMEDYFTNYRHTIVASLMFPEVNRYELMPWPERIYGRVPDSFSTTIGCVTNALQKISQIEASDKPALKAGVLIGDSAAYQRGDPTPFDMTGFYGLAAPLYATGIPIRVVPVERTVESGYLSQFKVLLLSYDYFKPMKPDYNAALAQWVKDGGWLVLAGGSSEYNNANQWWKESGFDTPDLHLLQQLGIKTKLRKTGKMRSFTYSEVAREAANVRDGSNRTQLKVAVPDVPPAGGFIVRFRDSQTADGWGPLVYSIQKPVSATVSRTIAVGTIEEQGMLVYDFGSLVNAAGGRFADNQSSFGYFFRYLPKGTDVVFDVQNQYLIDIAVLDSESADTLAANQGQVYTRTLYTPDKETMKMFGQEYRDSGQVDEGLLPLEEASIGASSLKMNGFMATPGKGGIIQVDVPATAFSRWAGAMGLLYDTAASAAGLTTARPTRYLQDRGPYRAVHALTDGYVVRGSWIDLYDRTLTVQQDVSLKQGESALLRKVEDKYSAPQILAASYKAGLVKSTNNLLTLEASGPEGTKGVIRIALAGKRTAAVKCWSVEPSGELTATAEQQGDTALIEFPQKAKGVRIELSLAE